MENTKTQEIKHPARHRVFTVIGVILCVILIPIVIINCTLIAKQFLNKDEVPSVGGVFPMIVLTDSMAGTFDGGSLLFCKTVDTNTIKEGDIICYFDPAGNGTTTTTHRVQEIKIAEDGTRSFITKGDANNAEDKQPVEASKVVGIYWFHIAGLGSVAMFMQTTPGLIIFVIVPILILVAYDVVRRRLYERNKDTETEALEEELRALRAQKAAQTGAEEPAAAAAGVTPAAAAGAAPAQQTAQPAPALTTARVVGENLPDINIEANSQPAPVATRQRSVQQQAPAQQKRTAAHTQQPAQQTQQTQQTQQHAAQKTQQHAAQQTRQAEPSQKERSAGRHAKRALDKSVPQGNPWA